VSYDQHSPCPPVPVAPARLCCLAQPLGRGLRGARSHCTGAARKRITRAAPRPPCSLLCSVHNLDAEQDVVLVEVEKKVRTMVVLDYITKSHILLHDGFAGTRMGGEPEIRDYFTIL